jgi:branched-chain amino acid aminotransferase
VDGDGALCTPPLDDHILASITRDRVISLMQAREAPLSKEDALAAQEAFLASTTREVQSVSAIEDREFPEAGEVTSKAAALLRAEIEQELGRV